MEKVISPPSDTDSSANASASAHYAYRSCYNRVLPLADPTVTADWLKWSDVEAEAEADAEAETEAAAEAPEAAKRRSGAASDAAHVPLFCVPSVFARFVQPGSFEFKGGPSASQDPSLPPGAIVSCTSAVLCCANHVFALRLSESERDKYCVYCRV